MTMDVKNRDPSAVPTTSDPSLEPQTPTQAQHAKDARAIKQRIAQRRQFEAARDLDGLGSAENLAPLQKSQTQIGSEQSDWTLTPETLRAVAQDANATVVLPPPASGIHAPTSTQARQLLKKLMLFQAPAEANASSSGSATSGSSKEAVASPAVTSQKSTTTSTDSTTTSSKSQKNLSPEEAELEASKQELLDVIKNHVTLNSGAAVNWQAFFNLLSIKNMKLMQELMQKQHEIQKLEATNANLGLLLSKENLQFNTDMERVESVINLASQFPNLNEAITGGPFRRLINANRLLPPEQLDLIGASKNTTMQGPVQDTYRRSYIHHMAGDAIDKPLIADPTRSNKTRLYIPRDNGQDAAQRYQTHNNTVPASQKILTSYTDKDGKTVALERTWLSTSEIQGLRPDDKANYTNNIMPIHRLMRIDDLTGRLGLLQNEVAILEHAAQRANDPAVQAELRNRANEIRPEMEQAQQVTLGHIDFVGHDEDRYTDLMRKRGELEELREQADQILHTLVSSTLKAGDAPANPDRLNKSAAEKALYEQTKRTLDWRAKNLDDALRLYNDSKKDNRRARFYSGAHGPVDFYVTHKQGLDALRAKQEKDPLTAEEQAEMRDHQHALGMQKRNAPDYLYGANEMSYQLNQLLQAHGNNPVEPEHMAQWSQQLAALRDQYPNVSRDRMLHHVRTRKSQLESEPEHGRYKIFNPIEDMKQQKVKFTDGSSEKQKIETREAFYEQEKQNLRNAEAFWSKSELWAAKKTANPIQTSFSPNSRLGKIANFATKTQTTFNLRGELYKPTRQARPAQTNAGAQPQLFSEKSFWLDEHGNIAAPVNLDNPREIDRHSDLSSGAGASIFANPKGNDHSAGAYQNQFFDKMSTAHSMLQYLVGNNVLQNDNGDMAQGMAEEASDEAQASMQQMNEILNEARQNTEALIERMLQRANEAIR